MQELPEKCLRGTDLASRLGFHLWTLLKTNFQESEAMLDKKKKKSCSEEN